MANAFKTVPVEEIRCEKCGEGVWGNMTIWHVNHGSTDAPRFRCDKHVKHLVPKSVLIDYAMNQLMGGVTLQ